MTKMEYAQTIARKLGGEVKEITKANGVKFTGILVGESDCRPTVYIDEFYDNGTYVLDAVEKIKQLLDNAPKLEVDKTGLYEYSKIKSKLRLRLYNKRSRVDCFKKATRYGFDDLIIVPYIENIVEGASARVTKGLLDMWGVTKDCVFKDAEANTKADGYRIRTMKKVLCEQIGMPEEMFPDDEMPLYVVSNMDGNYGAYAIILAADELKAKYPNGYYVIPSSIHEVLVVPASDDGTPYEFGNIINDVNESSVKETERLGTKQYFIKEE